MIHEQVLKQLEYLKSLVDNEIENEKNCKEWGISYIPSNRKYENIRLYNEYKTEIEKYGDKRLLIKARMNGNIYCFARRYIYESYLVYRCKNGAEIFVKEEDVQIIK